MKNIVEIKNLSKMYRISKYQNNTQTLKEALDAFRKKSINYMLRRPNAVPSSAQEEFWALKNINLDIKEGERLGILGRNGAGKSTLLKILSRITAPTEGSFKIRGRLASLLEVGTGFHPELSGKENIYLSGSILGLKQHEIKKKFDQIVAFSEVERFLSTPIKRFSSGMVTKLGFAIAAHLDPDLFIIDEVLAVGDQQFQEKCLFKINEMGKKGRTIIFVSHDIGTTLSLCTRGIFFENGTIRYDGPISNCISEYIRNNKEPAEVWEGDLGNENIRFHSIKLIKPDPHQDFYYQGDNIKLNIEFEINKPEKDIIFGVSVYDKRNLRLAQSYTYNNSDYINFFGKKGKHKISFLIDSAILHEGEYLLKFSCFKYNSWALTLEEITLKYQVYQGKKNIPFHDIYPRDGILLGNKWHLDSSQ